MVWNWNRFILDSQQIGKTCGNMNTGYPLTGIPGQPLGYGTPQNNRYSKYLNYNQ